MPAAGQSSFQSFATVMCIQQESRGELHARWHREHIEQSPSLQSACAACRTHPAILVQTPDALLESIAARARHQQQLASLVGHWKRALDTMTHKAAAIAKHGNQLQQKSLAMQHTDQAGTFHCMYTILYAFANRRLTSCMIACVFGQAIMICHKRECYCRRHSWS